jgi:hypothetical protein
MKNHFFKAGLLSCAAILMNAGALFAGIEGDQPRMEAAVKFLQEAKKADNPLPLLDKARNELRHASHNKAGWRPKAIHMVEEAIAKANEGDKQGVEDKCGHAIAEIHMGMAKAP